MTRVKNSKQSFAGKLFIIICLVLLIFYTLSLIISFGWGLMNSFKKPLFYIQDSLALLNGKNFTFGNYIDAFENFKVTVSASSGTRSVYLEEMALNSVLYAIGCAFVQTFSCCIMAYAVAKYKNKCSKLIYFIVIFAMSFPIVGSLPSEIQMLKSLGLHDSIFGTYLLAFNFLGMHFLVFHATFKSIPNAYAEAAEIDGASDWTIAFKIMLPLVKYTFLTVFLLKFINYWNDYQTPLVYIPNKPVLSYGLFRFSVGSGNSIDGALTNSIPHKLAACMIVFLPIFILLLFTHKRLIGNVSMGGIKG